MTARNRFLYLIIVLYILPVVVLSFYASLAFTPNHSFGILSAGVLLTVAGSILLFLYDNRQEPAPTPIFTPEPHQELQPQETGIDPELFQSLQEQLQAAQEQIHMQQRQQETLQQSIHEINRQKDAQERKFHEVNMEYQRFQENTQEQQEQKRLLLHEHQQTINEQRETLEKKQQQISQLESQIRDLHYEIKTLMEVEERQSIVRFPLERHRSKEFDYSPSFQEDDDIAVSPPHVHCPDEASQQLKRCLDIAQKITGGQYMHNRPSRLRDLPVENTALEMRRLFDNLRSENQATILLYSPKDNKLLFVNNPIKSLLGWTPEKFVQQFQELQVDGGDAWKQSLSQLAFKNESQATLCLSSKSGQQVSLNCHLGLIPTGSFRHFILGVLYPAK